MFITFGFSNWLLSGRSMKFTITVNKISKNANAAAMIRIFVSMSIAYPFPRRYGVVPRRQLFHPLVFLRRLVRLSCESEKLLVISVQFLFFFFCERSKKVRCIQTAVPPYLIGLFVNILT
jgi:hypothetical protein